MSGLHYLDIVLVIKGFYRGQKVLLIEFDKFSDVYWGYLQNGDGDQLASFAADDLKLVSKGFLTPKLVGTAQVFKLDDYR